MLLSDISIQRPVFATMMMVALVVLGIVSFRRLAIDEYPDVTNPIIIAQTTYRGASPEVMERQISRPIEEALNTVQGLRSGGVTSTSLEGVSIVRLEFELGVRIPTVQQDVQAKVARIRRQLPPDIDDPVIQHFDPNDRPIMSIALRSSERSIRDLTDLAFDRIATRLEAIPGVGGVNVVGGRKRQVRVRLYPAALRAYAVSPSQVVSVLQRENQEIPAGRIANGSTERLIRVTGRIVDPLAFRDIVVGIRGGVPIRVGDVGQVVDESEDVRSASLLDENDAVSLEILKVSGSNTVEVADAVRLAIGDLEKGLPSDLRLTVIRDDSLRIRDSLADVEATIVLGALLTIAIIYLFLNSWRSTVITGLTLPVSVLSACFGMWVLGFTVNTMTLIALSLAIGLLIDDAIVVRENIVRHIEMGKDHAQAARDGTDEIGLAVTATSLAVVAVFIPVAFMGGQIGKIFFQFGLTVTFAVLASLFVSFTLDPMLSSVWSDPDVAHRPAQGFAASSMGWPRRISLAFNARFDQVAAFYPQWLARALHRRWAVLGAAVLTVMLAFAIGRTLGFTWMPEVDGGEFNVNFRTPPGSRLEYTVTKGREIQAFLRAYPDVDFTYLTVGGGFRGTPNSGQLYVHLVDRGRRKASQFALQNELRRGLRGLTGVRPTITGTPTIFGGFRQPIIVNVQGPEPTRLKVAADRVFEAIRVVEGTAEPNSSEEGDIPQLDVRVDRQLAWAAGVGVGSIASTLQPLFAGQRATQWEDPQGYQHDVVVSYPDSMRMSASNVAEIPVSSLTINPRTGQPVVVPLSQVAEIAAGVGPQQIERRSLERQISISAGVLPGYAVGTVADRVRAAIDSIGLPPGYHTAFSGDVQNLNETKGYVREALLLAVVFIYLILASLFGSFLQPLAIMFSLPLSFIGVAIALKLTGGTLNVMTMIGMIMLLGLVVKNGILLIDFTNGQRASGQPRRDALLAAARVRLRPIIMTTVAMIFGMLPLALALGRGSEARAPMARAVIGGLITSTLLTLFVVPVVYTLLDDAGSWLRRRVSSREPVLATREHGVMASE
ncbi:MAG: hypothetical protein NVSMB22_00680 [Chloroflexota bacterium]